MHLSQGRRRLSVGAGAGSDQKRNRWRLPARVEFEIMDGRPVERKLAAILSGDVEGYSRLMGDDEVATVHTITEYREAFASSVVRHGGRVVDAPGDNVLAEFASVVDAVHCAVEIQGELRSRNAICRSPAGCSSASGSISAT